MGTGGLEEAAWVFGWKGGVLRLVQPLQTTRRELYYLRQRVYRRHGHKPGVTDVSTMAPGQSFLARPNFYYLAKCGRPCWLPLRLDTSVPTRGDGKHVNNGWPCEYYQPHDRRAGPACYSNSPSDGDWLRVVGQVRGPTLRNEIGQRSDVWDVVQVPPNRVLQHVDQLALAPDGLHRLAYVGDLWLGNTGWHDIPWNPQS